MAVAGFLFFPAPVVDKNHQVTLMTPQRLEVYSLLTMMVQSPVLGTQAALVDCLANVECAKFVTRGSEERVCSGHVCSGVERRQQPYGSRLCQLVQQVG
jgi:hypothetical protein